MQSPVHIDWRLLMLLTLAGADRHGRRPRCCAVASAAPKLKAGFGWFVLAMSVVIAAARASGPSAWCEGIVRRMCLPLLGAFFIGLSKVGICHRPGHADDAAGGHAMSARQAIGIVLPLLCVADALTMGMLLEASGTRRRCGRRSPARSSGIGVGMLFVSRVSNQTLGLAIGIVGLTMVALLVIRARWYPDHSYQPRLIDSLLVGIVCGFSSTIAHAAGPIFALFLMAQRLPKDVFIATNAVFFTVNNLLKVAALRRLGSDHGADAASRPPSAADDSGRHRRGLGHQPPASPEATSTGWCSCCWC